MVSQIIVLFLILFSSFSIATENPSNQSVTLTPVKVIELKRNIAVALEDIYLHPKRAQYIATSLKSESFNASLNSEVDREQFRQALRTQIVKATMDTGIDIKQQAPTYTHSVSGEVVFDTLNGSITTELSGDNIGYLKITGQLDFNKTTHLLNDAVRYVKNVDALIIDITLADKTELSLVQQLVSYFVPNGTVLGELLINGVNKTISAKSTKQYAKLENNLPLYILTSSFVSQEWEFFSHTLLQLRKATIVGEATMGVATLNTSIDVGSHTILELPYAQFIALDSEDNWQGVGVIPDYEIASQKAFNKAYELAQTRISKKSKTIQ
ncbi:MAG: hypothetical protein HWE10_08675 [Gammaproteobacteria bacterium]|nr:hypothetical protein [Gammaproteobacteria bacterium]